MESRFEQAYGPHGPWVQCFSQSPEYIATELIRDVNDSRRYLTIDLWTSRAAYERFREQNREQYAAIDAECEPMSEREIEIGKFEVVR
jgi:heme-degrading monooxygenase HmoA